MLHNCGNIKNNKMEKEKRKYRVSCLADEETYLDIKYFEKPEDAIHYFIELQIKFPDYFEVEIKSF